MFVKLQKRNPLVVLILSLITFGLYGIYWVARVRNELNSLGASIPNIVLFFIPFVNIYFLYRYAQEYSRIITKDHNSILWFLLLFFLLPVAMVIFQISLNEFADQQPQQPQQEPQNS